MLGPIQGREAHVKKFLLRKRIRHLSTVAWGGWHGTVFRLHPEYARHAPRAVEAAHLKLWRQLRPEANPDTLEVCYNISGQADARIVPEEVNALEVESSLNSHHYGVLWETKEPYDRAVREGLPRQRGPQHQEDL